MGRKLKATSRVGLSASAWRSLAKSAWSGSSDESGKASFQGLLGLAVMGTMVYLAMTVIPVRAAAYQFDDEVREQVVLLGSGRRRVTDQEVRRTIFTRSQELGVPIKERDIKIIRRRGYVHITVDYTMTVEFALGYRYDWNFEADYEGPSF